MKLAILTCGMLPIPAVLAITCIRTSHPQKSAIFDFFLKMAKVS